MNHYSKIIRSALFTILLAVLLHLNAKPNLAVADNEKISAESSAATLMAHWQFEEGSGAIVGDSGTNNFDGTISGAAWSTQVNGATTSTRSLEFDGSNDYIDSVDFDINNDFTVTAWINPDEMTNRAIISKHTSGGGNLLIVGFYSDGYHLNLRNKGYTAGTPQSGWQHIAVTGEEIATGTHLTFYRDGLKLWEFNSEAKVDDFSGGKGWTIGQDWDNQNRTDFFDGHIDDVRIYNGALTQAEVENLAADFATTCNVNDEPALIAAAANTSCDIIEMAAGTYDIANIVPNHNVVIRGASEATTIIDVETSGGSARAFGTSGKTSLTLQNMTIQNGNVTGGSRGGAVYNAQGAYLYLQDVTFKDNQAAGSGGALSSDGNMVAERVSFVNNNAPEGGAIALGADVQAKISDSTFTNNTVSVLGGAIYAVGGNINLSISDSSFSNNYAGAEGGAINLETSGTFAIDGSTFTSNTTDGSGGAILNNTNSSLTVRTTKFESNSAVFNGGSIANWNNASLTIEDSYFVANSANSASASQGGGGALRNASGATAAISRSLFKDNTVNDDGGAIAQMPTGGLITVSDSTFTGNEATVGGAIHSTGPINLSFNTFHNNQSTNSVGGTVLRIFGNTTTIQGNIFSSTGQNCSFGGSSTIVSLGHNMSSDETCLADETNGDRLNIDPLLGVLADNGGKWHSFLPQPSSPVIDAGSIDCEGFDQRGVERPNGLHINGMPAPTSQCDIGAVELGDGEPVSDEIAQQRLIDYQNFASLNDPLVASCEALPTRSANTFSIPMAGYQQPDTPILHHEAGYTAAVEPGQQALIRSVDSNGRSVTAEGTLYDDPLRGNYGLVNLDQIVSTWVDDGSLMLDSTQASEVQSGEFAMTVIPEQIVGSEIEIGDHPTNYQFDVATGDLNGDNRSEKIVAWRSENVANAPIHLRVSSLPGETNLLKSEPVAQAFNNKLYLFAQGYDDALWVGVDNNGFWQWQRCGGTLTSGPAVTAVSGDTLKIVAVGTNGKLNQRTLSTSGATAWGEVAGQPSNTFDGTPALTTDSNGNVHIFGRDTQNTVLHASDSGSGFTGWQNLGGYLAEGPDAISFGSGKVMLMVRGFDNALWYRQLSGTWSGWQTVVSTSGSATLHSTPTAISKTASAFDVYARTSDNKLSKLTFNGTNFGSWQAMAVSATVGSRPAVLNNGSETIVYAAFPDNGVLQRSDAGAEWVQVNALAPGSSSTNTTIIPETSASPISLASGYFLADGRAQLALATVNDQGQAVVHAYKAHGGFSPQEIGNITLPRILTGPKQVALTSGDFNGSGSDEIAVISLFNPVQVSGVSYSGAEINILRVENGQLSLLSTHQSTVNLSDGPASFNPSHAAITSGNFQGDGKHDIAFTYSYKNPVDSNAWSPVILLDVDEDDFSMERDGLRLSSNQLDSAGHVDIAAGDFTSTDEDGIKRDEIIWGHPHGSNNKLGELIVLEVDGENAIDGKSSIIFDTNNLPYSLDAGDLDRDLKDEIALMLWLGNTTDKQLVTYDVTTDPTWSINAIGRRNYPASSGNQYGVAIAMGDVTGQSLRVGAPNYRLQQNVGNLIAIINAPPTHLDTVDGNSISIGVGEAGTYTRYSNTQGTSAEVSFDSKRSFSMALDTELTVGDPEGTHVTGSLGASYGSDFERGRTDLTEQTINQTLEATNDDFALFSGTSYQTWEYPLYADNSGVPATYINVVFPVPNSEAVYQGGQRTCDGWYLPTHEIHNIWSYTPLGQQDGFIGYSPSANSTMYEGNVIAPGGGTSSWTFNMSNNATNKYSSSVRLGMTAGLETQIGGDSVDVGVNVGIFSASKKVTAPSLKGSFKSEYSSSSTSSHTMQTFSDIEIETSFGGITSLEQFDVQSFLYWADGGYMVLDHTATPKAQGVWLGYDSADPAFRRPFAIDALCGPNKIDFSPEITVDPPYAEIGESVKISAQVHNYSNVSANNVKVRFYLGDPDNGGKQIGTDRIISNLTRTSGSQTVSIDWFAEGSGEQRIYAVIDPDNQLAEVHDEVSNTNNNKAYNLLTLAVTDFVDIGLAETQAYYPLEFGTVGAVGRAAAGDDLTYSAHIALEGLEETLQFELAPSTAKLATPSELSFVGTPLALSAWDKGISIQVDLTPMDDVTAPSVMQVNYPDSVEDSHVTVRRWNGSSWVDATCNGRMVDQITDINQFLVPVCETGTYAVFSSETPIVNTPYKLFLPVTLK